MTQKQINVFEELLADQNFQGKPQLKHLLWLNTVSPKYKVGECFKVTDRARKIYGYPVINFNAKVIRVFTWKDQEEYQYELEMECECNGKHSTSKVHKTERELNASKRCKDNINVIGFPKSEFEDSISVRL